MNMIFKKAILEHKEAIFSWLDEPHVKEFWDNSQAHRDDIEIFMADRKILSPYFGGMFSYWVGISEHEPYCLIMTHEELDTVDVPDYFKPYLSKTGKTFGLDFWLLAGICGSITPMNANYMGDSVPQSPCPSPGRQDGQCCPSLH